MVYPAIAKLSHCSVRAKRRYSATMPEVRSDSLPGGGALAMRLGLRLTVVRPQI